MSDTAMLRPSDFAEIRRTSKRPVGGALKSYKCFCCGSCLALSNHHITPRDDGGSDSHRNKVTLCSKCHDAVEGKDWKDILALRDSIRTERYRTQHGREQTDSKNWVGRTPIEKVASIRRYCLTRGVLQNHEGTAEDFRQAFRTLNRLYCELNPQSGISAASRCEAKVIFSPPQPPRIVTAPNPHKDKISEMLWHGTTGQWVGAILELASSCLRGGAQNA